MKYAPGLHVSIPKYILVFANNLFEIEKKLAASGDTGNVSRNILKMKEALEENGVTYENPIGQSFNETRTDLDASISGPGTEDLYVVDVMKPIIRVTGSGLSSVVQKGIVVVESRTGGNSNE
jgi:hypothetical protein